MAPKKLYLQPDADLPMQKALEESVRDRHFPLEGHIERQQDPMETDPPDPPRETIEDCIRKLSVRQTGALPNMQTNGGDTLVFIDPPSQQPEQSDEDYDDFLSRYQNPIIMRSQKLAAASPVIGQRFAPTRQFHLLRRRGLVNKLESGIKYVIDLTPPTEGDTAVYLTATLSCCEGVRFWHQACEIWNVSNQLVGGSEEWSTSSSPQVSAAGGLTLEYCPIRHRSAIRRVLAAIEGFDMGLDSATKIWNAAVIAGELKTTTMTCPFLTDSLLTWLRVEPNNHFLEVNPEVTLQIATFIHNKDLARDVFAILTGEAALDMVSDQVNGPRARKQSIFGRKQESLPEEWIERIQYASRTFSERHAATFHQLAMAGMTWIEELPAIKHLRTFHGEEVQLHIDNLIQQLIELVKHEIAAELVDHRGPTLWGESENRPEWRLLPKVHVWETYECLTLSQRIWTRAFWEKLHCKAPLSCYPLRRAEINYEAIRRKHSDDPLVEFMPRTTYIEAYRRAQNAVEMGQTFLTSGFASTATLLHGQVLPADEAQSWNRKKGITSDIDMGTFFTDPSESNLANDEHAKDSLCGEQSKGEDLYYSFKWDEDLNSDVLPDTKWIGRTEDIATPRDSPVSPAITTRPTTQRTVIPDTAWATGSEAVATSEDSPVAPEGANRPTTQRAVVFDGSSFPNMRLTQEKSKQSITDPAIHDYRKTFFNLDTFLCETDAYIKRIAQEKLAPADVLNTQEPFRTRITPTLTSLAQSEWQYLPLWADGLDDGTGAIFSDDPIEAPAGAGFSTSGPSIHTGDSTYSSSSHGDEDGEFDMLSAADSASTSFNYSTAVADGNSDQIFKGKIYTPGSTIGSDTDDGLDREVQSYFEEEKAKLVIRSFEQQQRRQVQALDSSGSQNQMRPKAAQDDCYDDLFDGADSDDEGFNSDSTERGEILDLSSDDNDNDDEDGGVLVERAQAQSGTTGNGHKA